LLNVLLCPIHNPPLMQASRLMPQKSIEFHLATNAFHSSSDKLKFAK
jgi:hypothetical protein